MAKPEKLSCDGCSKEELEENTTEWVRKLIPGKDFCSKKCASRYVKNFYDDSKDADELEEQEEPKEVLEERPKLKKPTTSNTEEVWKVKNAPSQYTPVIHNEITDETVDVTKALANMLNKLEDILKRL